MRLRDATPSLGGTANDPGATIAESANLEKGKELRILWTWMARDDHGSHSYSSGFDGIRYL